MVWPLHLDCLESLSANLCESHLQEDFRYLEWGIRVQGRRSDIFQLVSWRDYSMSKTRDMTQAPRDRATSWIYRFWQDVIPESVESNKPRTEAWAATHWWSCWVLSCHGWELWRRGWPKHIGPHSVSFVSWSSIFCTSFPPYCCFLGFALDFFVL